jgi:hypothetical protein
LFFGVDGVDCRLLFTVDERHVALHLTLTVTQERSAVLVILSARRAEDEKREQRNGEYVSHVLLLSTTVRIRPGILERVIHPVERRRLRTFARSAFGEENRHQSCILYTLLCEGCRNHRSRTADNVFDLEERIAELQHLADYYVATKVERNVKLPVERKLESQVR